jgi:UDP-glucuronate 4-epimerase
MTYLVTGAAGFIGFSLSRRLLEMGRTVVGLDNLNDYYPVALKRARLAQLGGHPNFTFEQADLADADGLKAALAGKSITRVVNLAAQAGVRYSLENPQAYIRSNVVGFTNLLEWCRAEGCVESIAYASSSSVYGGNTKLPFSETDRVDHPISLYAATKKANEEIAHVYAHLFGLPLTGLRFFTVYGPWGRPDMAMWLFTKAILDGKPINVFNHGQMRRDFTYIDDIVSGVVSVTDSPPAAGDGPPHRIYNIGNNHPEDLMYMIGLIEQAVGATAEKVMLPLQPGDVPETYADIEAIRADHGFEPTTRIEDGIPRFVDWFMRHREFSR